MLLDGVVADDGCVSIQSLHVRDDERGLFLVGKRIEGDMDRVCWYGVVDSEGVVDGPVWVLGEGGGSDSRVVL